MVGTIAEQKIKKYLQNEGMQIVEMNYRCKMGEVDIIARDGEYYVFIEVKYRKSYQFGSPQEAVHFSKQSIISKVALFYLCQNRLKEETPIRFDVAAIYGDDITYIKNAFDYIGK